MRHNLFTIVVEHFLTATGGYRDLPIAYGRPHMAWSEPAAPPPGECLPTTDMFRRLARTMGLDTPALYDSDETIARQILAAGVFRWLVSHSRN